MFTSALTLTAETEFVQSLYSTNGDRLSPLPTALAAFARYGGRLALPRSWTASPGGGAHRARRAEGDAGEVACRGGPIATPSSNERKSKPINNGRDASRCLL